MQAGRLPNPGFSFSKTSGGGAQEIERGLHINLARLLASLGTYAYSTDRDAIYAHLFGASRTELEVAGVNVGLNQETEYPWDGRVRWTLAPAAPVSFRMCLRIPGWCRRFKVSINGRRVKEPNLKKGYLRLERLWKSGDWIELNLEMPVERIESHPSVRENCGMVALQRGPVVYCVESRDNGSDLADLSLPGEGKLKVSERVVAGLKIPVIEGEGRRRDRRSWKDELYRADRTELKAARIRAIPYFMWDNRGDGGEMRIWIRRS